MPFIIVVDNVRSLFNVGSIFRLADALEITELYLCGITGYPKQSGVTDDRHDWVANRADKELRKTGLVSIDAVKWRYWPNTLEAIADLKAQKFQILGLELTVGSIPYFEAKIQFPTALVIGHETDGVANSVLDQCDQVISLPMYGVGKSLNVATALAVAGYEIRHQWENK